LKTVSQFELFEDQWMYAVFFSCLVKLELLFENLILSSRGVVLNKKCIEK